jgi:hypothetical protein
VEPEQQQKVLSKNKHFIILVNPKHEIVGTNLFLLILIEKIVRFDFFLLCNLIFETLK